jgi:hypothetical protein
VELGAAVAGGEGASGAWVGWRALMALSGGKKEERGRGEGRRCAAAMGGMGALKVGDDKR